MTVTKGSDKFVSIGDAFVISLPCDIGLLDELEQWQFYYNWQRVQGSLGKTPMERCCELSEQTRISDEVYPFFDEDRERAFQRKRQRTQRVKK